MEHGLKGKTALITASSKGIGKAVAETFAAEGCKVAICSRTKDDLLSTVNEFKHKFGFEPLWCVCDLNKHSDIENTYNAVVKEYGSVDILVNNCGGPSPGYFFDIDEHDWNFAYEQVLMSVVRFSKLVLPGMIKKQWGRIINITSISVKQPVDNLMLSNSLRAGVTGFAKSLSNEVARHNITINNVAPGLTLTNRLYELAVIEAKEKGTSHEDILSQMAKRVPMNRLAGPEEIASVVLFLASKMAGYVTGTTIQVDGGYVKGLL
ncbi:3-oxoacyl-[acyl-carrier-protein] reductase FabG [bacterium BMS3Abin03]|nr:3-oxoacyl-[acyl-carrier-protein] reductase FabG [bacterium BMS3Abin03]